MIPGGNTPWNLLKFLAYFALSLPLNALRSAWGKLKGIGSPHD